MTELSELILVADKLMNSLDQAANNEKRFGNEICFELEKMSRSTLRLANDLKKIKEWGI